MGWEHVLALALPCVMTIISRSRIVLDAFLDPVDGFFVECLCEAKRDELRSAPSPGEDGHESTGG